LNENICIRGKRIETVTSDLITTDRGDLSLCLKTIPQTGPFLLR
jgi:hypothetical protein